MTIFETIGIGYAIFSCAITTSLIAWLAYLGVRSFFAQPERDMNLDEIVEAVERKQFERISK